MPLHPAIAANPNRLNRLAAMLLALAGLADGAAGRSSAVCWLVIWLLHPAEAAARDLVVDLMPGPACPLAPEPLRPRIAAAEARRLADTLRVLAALLAALAAHCVAACPNPPENRPAPRAVPRLRPSRVPAIAGLDSS